MTVLVSYSFTTCGSRDRQGPTDEECVDYYCNSGSPVCDHLIYISHRGSQTFVVPRSGNYTVTIAGASGGHGVCSNYSGLGVKAKETVQLKRGEILLVSVGQQGTSACDGYKDIDVCEISNDTEACEHLWNTLQDSLSPEESDYYLFDGGGGGGGASLLQVFHGNTIQILNDSLLVIAPGGGGAGAIYNIATFLHLLNSTYNNSDDLEALYRNYTYGHAFATFSENANGTAGLQEYINSARAGAGYFSATLDVTALENFGYGSTDCTENTVRFTLFPDTHGGFGGGGGGCNGGGGGGGYTGGSIIVDGAAIPGEGGYSWPYPPWPLIGYNDGDGYVELFLESCGCTYNCIIYNQSSFDCSCPSDTLLALNGLDCYAEGCIIYHPLCYYLYTELRTYT